jgi:DeoR family ulaG and ulaABCDEF operon transcriptional repressor
MLERERHGTIQRLLDLNSFATIHDIVEATGASEATVRRDFAELERAGVLRRIRGGVELAAAEGSAAADSPAGERREPTLDRRMWQNLEPKRRIARQACSYVKDRDTIFIDGGSTTFQMAEGLSALDATVVTNSFALAGHLLRHSRCGIILPEGFLDTESQLILNNLSADPFANYHAAIAFMGVEGITEAALTNTDPLLIQMERSMIAHARELVILADESKFGRIGRLKLCPAERATRIVTTTEADPTLVAALRERGVEVVLV